MGLPVLSAVTAARRGCRFDKFARSKSKASQRRIELAAYNTLI